MKSVGDGTCLIHVHSLAESDELHFVGPPGPIVDMAFAHSATPASEFFLGCMDARGNVGVYRLTCQDLGFCNLKKENFLIWMNDGAPSSIEGSPFIRWCPFACPEVIKLFPFIFYTLLLALVPQIAPTVRYPARR